MGPFTVKRKRWVCQKLQVHHRDRWVIQKCSRVYEWIKIFWFVVKSRMSKCLNHYSGDRDVFPIMEQQRTLSSVVKPN